MMPENRIKKLCHLSRRGSRYRIVCAIGNERRRTCACCLNNSRNIQRLFANIKSVPKHPNLSKLVAVWSVPLALRLEPNPLLPTWKLAQAPNGFLHCLDG